LIFATPLSSPDYMGHTEQRAGQKGKADRERKSQTIDGCEVSKRTIQPASTWKRRETNVETTSTREGATPLM